MGGACYFPVLVFVLLFRGSLVGRVKVTLPVIVHTRSDRGYSRYLPSSRSVTHDRRLSRYFITEGDLIMLKSGNPGAVMEAFCENIMTKKFTCIFYINNPFFHNSNPPASKFVYSLARFLGIPVIAWDPELIMSPKVSLVKWMPLFVCYWFCMIFCCCK